MLAYFILLHILLRQEIRKNQEFAVADLLNGARRAATFSPRSSKPKVNRSATTGQLPACSKPLAFDSRIVSRECASDLRKSYPAVLVQVAGPVARFASQALKSCVTMQVILGDLRIPPEPRP